MTRCPISFRWPLLLGLLTVGFLTVDLPGDARAACVSSRLFGSGDSYVVTPGFHDGGGFSDSSITANFQGAFWALGAGDPAAGGIDNGSYQALSTTGGPGWVYIYPGYPAILVGDWSDPDVDGCIDVAPEPRCMAILLADAAPFDHAAFAVLTDLPDELGNFDFEQPERRDIDLATWSRPRITASMSSPEGVRVTVVVDAPTGGRYLSPECGADPLLGYRLYEQQVPRDQPRPTSPRREDWSPLPDGVGPGGEAIPFGVEHTVTVRWCDPDWPHGASVFLTATLVFEGGFETPFVGPLATAISLGYPGGCPCVGCDPDRDGDGFAPDVDCDDGNAAVYPGAVQLCDQVNNDCNAPDWPTVPADEFDGDGDGFLACEGDCDDTDPRVWPGAPQLCDGINNDCASDWPVVPGPEADVDGDGFSACEGDCDDGVATTHPLAADVCNGIDDDCDGRTDENCTTCPGKLDFDRDGIHDPCDNCLVLPNPGQTDRDEDREGDLCDLDDGLVILTFPDPEVVEWQAESGIASWNLHRGSLEALLATRVYTQEPGSHPLVSRACGVSGSTAPDFAEVLPGEPAFYLVSGATLEAFNGLGLPDLWRPSHHPCP